jgi:hypothetical protein
MRGSKCDIPLYHTILILKRELSMVEEKGISIGEPIIDQMEGIQVLIVIPQIFINHWRENYMKKENKIKFNQYIIIKQSQIIIGTRYAYQRGFSALIVSLFIVPKLAVSNGLSFEGSMYIFNVLSPTPV